MNPLSSIRIAFAALRLNLMRSMPTMLGIIIGAASVITMIAVGAGAEARIAQQIDSLGSNLIIVVSGAIDPEGPLSGRELGGLRCGASQTGRTDDLGVAASGSTASTSRRQIRACSRAEPAKALPSAW
ncbi:hypothetical protein E6C67_13010 [Azospirillum sp. TSA2s]|nr:hypothetical protein E6C67_13010 [Azospirillum sp. TSA2s]